MRVAEERKDVDPRGDLLEVQNRSSAVHKGENEGSCGLQREWRDKGGRKREGRVVQVGVCGRLEDPWKLLRWRSWLSIWRGLWISSIDTGIKLVGAALVNRTLNKWGVQNILRSAWKELGEVEIKWVCDNLFIITVPDETTAAQILNQVPWALMKQNFSVKRWPQELALEEVQVEFVPFWVQIRGMPLFLNSEVNVKRLACEIGEFMEFEDPSKARGFLSVRVLVDTEKSRIGHPNTECSFDPSSGGVAGYGEWTKIGLIREMVDPSTSYLGRAWERRVAGTVRYGHTPNLQNEEVLLWTKGNSEFVPLPIEPSQKGMHLGTRRGRPRRVKQISNAAKKGSSSTQESPSLQSAHGTSLAQGMDQGGVVQAMSEAHGIPINLGGY
ncbi:hypothetical protein EV2_026314 [Malus domestica]